ncbi:alpha/beta hydrolase [Streptomyces sp. NPDC018019]|uniref:alpha/beta hydrolase n=1 Tax=Streptomyces sp. NPDC018019 TaxID=3365030 RepID=UPI00378C1C47
MKAAALYGTLGSLVLTALVAVPADGITRQAAARDRTPAPAPPRIAFGRCAPEEHLPSGVECGRLTVPLDYAHPRGKKITLTVSRARATGSAGERQGALVFNPGGPGASSMNFPLYAKTDRWRRTARAYDFVGYAPRGVGRSAPLSCQDPAEFAKIPSASPRHPSEAFKRKKFAEAEAYAQGCARHAGSSLRHFTSANNARDLDMLRAGLGEKKLTYMGASYGTYFGAVYATLFPGHVRRMVFDSIVNPDPRQIWYRNNLEQNLGFQRRWEDWGRWVAKHHKTYHLGTTPQAVLRTYDTVRERLGRRPLGGKVGSAQLQAAFLKTGYNDAYWPVRAAALATYVKGDPRLLLKQATPPAEGAKADENGNAVYTAVECNDGRWPRDLRVWDRDNTASARVAPFETWDNAWMNLPCAFWPRFSPRNAAQDPTRYAEEVTEAALPPAGAPHHPVDVRTAPGALPPVLLLAAERDAATPYSGAVELRRRLSGSALVTERGAGTHGVSFGPNACANGHVERYLLTGRTPARDTVCAPRPEPRPLMPAAKQRRGR